MTAYLFPVKTAFILFPFLAMFLLIPFLIFNYRKYGYLNKWRSFILYSLLLYLLNAYFLVILPLPQTFDTCSLQPANTQHMQLAPFYFIQEISSHTSAVLTKPATYFYLLKESAFLQVAFNVLLTVPFGIYLRYYFRRSFLQTICISFFLSLFFELTQVTGLYGIYNCAYRLFDIDDLFLNTLGGVIGFIIAPIFTYFLPKTNELDSHINLETKPVGFIRRLIAMQIDWIFLSIVVPVVKNKGNSFFVSNMQSYTNMYELIFITCSILIYFIIIPYFTNGKTIGKALLRIHVKGKSNRITLKELFIRYGIFYFALGGINYILSSSSILNHTEPLVLLVTLLFLFIINGLFIIHVLLHVFSRDKLLFYEHISHTRNAITLKKADK
ncbi:VanZ family protein [Bacillus cereus]|uniref:VanZ family protein n=1 Tax=Bacillus cereus TaxID=1396 RepID=A0AB73UFH8_BACCE|nr:VanZ family protein [Bacillus cereus]CKF86996.1 VanZ/RDD domain-containing protein [Streptococcus pneumoniae]KMP38064.1 permease [Bacillus cereus]MDA1951536.1 VanZ family protein [Bacillus cereus]PGW75939.1 VanZ family protein [Bacillus cereus]QHV02506.1 VanZ family protein [Bacillus cereus]